LFHATASTASSPLPLPDALPILRAPAAQALAARPQTAPLRLCPYHYTWDESMRRTVSGPKRWRSTPRPAPRPPANRPPTISSLRSEEHTSELQSLTNLVCRLLLP